MEKQVSFYGLYLCLLDQNRIKFLHKILEVFWDYEKVLLRQNMETFLPVKMPCCLAKHAMTEV